MSEVSISGLALYRQMQAEFDFSPVINTMLRENMATDRAEAGSLLDAFLQWISLVPNLDRGKTFVMLKTPVDSAFHAMILNTKLYQQFCERYFGFFIHHHPLEEDEATAEIYAGVHYTIDLLECTYGEALHPALQEWRNQIDAGAYVVSCPSCCDDETNPAGQTVVGKLPSGAMLVH